jgi:NADPH:quinone reductase-like Zn-dependent oxidoreductase
MLHRVAKVKPGSRILVHGASGAVGTALIRLGLLHELELYGTVAAAHRDFVSGAGVIPIDYQKEDFVEFINLLKPKGVDAIFDGFGGRNFQRSFRCLRKGGVLVAFGSYGPSTGKESGGLGSYAGIMIKSLFTPGKSAVMYNIVPFKEKHPDWFRDDLTGLLYLLEHGRIKPVISKKLPLVQAAEAHRMLEAGGVKGKIVLMSET